MKKIFLISFLIVELAGSFNQAIADYCPDASAIHYVPAAEIWEAPGNWVGSKSYDDGIKNVIVLKQAVYQRFVLPGSLLTCQYLTEPKGEVLTMGNDKSHTYPIPSGIHWVPEGNGLVCNGPDIADCPF